MGLKHQRHFGASFMVPIPGHSGLVNHCGCRGAWRAGEGILEELPIEVRVYGYPFLYPFLLSWILWPEVEGLWKKCFPSIRCFRCIYIYIYTYRYMYTSLQLRNGSQMPQALQFGWQLLIYRQIFKDTSLFETCSPKVS